MKLKTNESENKDLELKRNQSEDSIYSNESKSHDFLLYKEEKETNEKNGKKIPSLINRKEKREINSKRNNLKLKLKDLHETKSKHSHSPQYYTTIREEKEKKKEEMPKIHPLSSLINRKSSKNISILEKIKCDCGLQEESLAIFQKEDQGMSLMKMKTIILEERQKSNLSKLKKSNNFKLLELANRIKKKDINFMTRKIGKIRIQKNHENECLTEMNKRMHEIIDKVKSSKREKNGFFVTGNEPSSYNFYFKKQLK